jgi:hypothetical protein
VVSNLPLGSVIHLPIFYPFFPASVKSFFWGLVAFTRVAMSDTFQRLQSWQITSGISRAYSGLGSTMWTINTHNMHFTLMNVQLCPVYFPVSYLFFCTRAHTHKKKKNNSLRLFYISFWNCGSTLHTTRWPQARQACESVRHPHPSTSASVISIFLLRKSWQHKTIRSLRFCTKFGTKCIRWKLWKVWEFGKKASLRLLGW